MHVLLGHLDEQIQVEGALRSDEEREEAIVNAASLKEETTSFKKELVDLKKKKQMLSKANAVAKAQVSEVEQELGWHSEPIRKGTEDILAKEWNIEGGDILGNKCRKLMSCARGIMDQMKVFSSEKLEEDGGSERAKREVTKQCEVVAK
jgi:hypothetical protein